MSAETPLLDAELERFGSDLLTAAATPVTAQRRLRRPSGRLVAAVIVALVLLVPAAIAAVNGVFLADDRPMIEPPPGYTAPKVAGPVVEVASGAVAAGPWRAYAVRCGTAVSVVVVAPDGTRNSAACGAFRSGRQRAHPAFAPSTMYDGVSQTTFIYSAVPATVARVTLDVDLPGAGPSHHELQPISVPDAAQKLRRDVKFVVLALPGEQGVVRAVATDAAGEVISRCERSHCESG